MFAEAEKFMRDYLGQIGEDEKTKVYSEILSGSHPSKDYFIMFVISATIATLGLLTNSVAAIIGAMLVSPLLTPVIGISLGAVKGDLKLFWLALEAEAKGIALVLLLVVGLSLLVPSAAATSEILLRTHPTPLDLVVAIASGAAAAYALSRKNIGATLPGVAIAVAVLPPLCVVGIGFSLRRIDIAIGGALMFAANVVAINFAASIVFWLVGFGPKAAEATNNDTIQRLKTSAVLLLLILAPLAWIMWGSISSANMKNTVERVLQSQIDGIDQASLAGFSYQEGKDGVVVVSATIDSPKEITAAKASEMRTALEKNLGGKVDLYLKVNQLVLFEAMHGGN